MSDLVGNPEDRFSRVAAQIKMDKTYKVYNRTELDLNIFQNSDNIQIYGPSHKKINNICFLYADSTNPLLSKFKISSLWPTSMLVSARFVSDLFGNYIAVFSLYEKNDMTVILHFAESNLGLWSGSFFLVAPFPDHCLLVPLIITDHCYNTCALRKHAHATHISFPLLIFFVLFILYSKHNLSTNLSEAVLTSTNNLCFCSKIRKKYQPMETVY